MSIVGDNPWDDGLDFIGCPPRPTQLILPQLPETLQGDCKLICWGRCLPVPDGERMMRVVINEFKPDPQRCSAYTGIVLFIDSATGDVWYKGELHFYYTRNYLDLETLPNGRGKRSIALRFVVKGDITRVSDKMPEWECLILCTKTTEQVKSYERIFVYGGLDLLVDSESQKMTGFRLGLGHNDGWYTHHPDCSARPIPWTGHGDYIGHYCERGWLFVAPGRNFVFQPNIRPPTGRFTEEALRAVRKDCVTEDAVRYGAFDLRHIRCIHSYQELSGLTECKTSFASHESCQGLVYTRAKYPWITFFSMGYWMDRWEKQADTLHLVEGTITVGQERLEQRPRRFSVYGFATHNPQTDLKLVDLASNKTVIGEPADTELLLYLYNAGLPRRNPLRQIPVPIEPKVTMQLLRDEILATKDQDLCPFLKEREPTI